MKVRVLGVYYFDSQSGQSQLLATPSDSAVAELLPPNQILYRGAFNSDVFQGDLRYTYCKGGFESDVIITRRPKLAPADCGFNPATTLLQVRHQWQNAPPPRRLLPTTAGQGAAALPDEFIDLGELFFAQGRGFLTDGSSNTNTNVPVVVTVPSPASFATNVPVAKEWHAGAAAAGASLLIESVAWNSIVANLNQLPLMARADGPAKGAVAPKSPSLKQALPMRHPIRLAAAATRSPGFVLDYLTIYGTGQDFTFQNCVSGSGPTYVIDGSYIHGPATFTGTVTFQSGCVIKFLSLSYPSGGPAYLMLRGPVVCNGAQSSPSIITSYYDLLYGEVISRTSQPCVGDVGTGLWVYYDQNTVNLDGMGIRFAATAIEVDNYQQLQTNPPPSQLEGQTGASTGEAGGLGIQPAIPIEPCNLAGCSLYACTTGVLANYENVYIATSASASVITPIVANGCSVGGSFSAGSAPMMTTSPSAQLALPNGTATFSASAASPWGAICVWYWGDIQETWSQHPPVFIATNVSSITLTGSQVPSTCGAYDVAVAAINPFSDQQHPTGWTTMLGVADTNAMSLWNNFTQYTNGLTPVIWATRDANTPPRYASWNSSGLLYGWCAAHGGRTDFTGIAPRNDWDAEYTGTVPVVALTRRHGHVRGHYLGMDGTHGLNTNLISARVWFCDAASDSLVQMVVQNAYTRSDSTGDSTILIFTSDLPSTITPMQVVAPPASYAVCLAAACEGNTVDANLEDGQTSIL